VIGAIIAALLVAVFAMARHVSGSTVGGVSGEEAIVAATAKIRNQMLASAAVGSLLDATVASTLLLLGWRSLTSAAFPALGHALPWPTRRLTGTAARVVALFLLLAGTLSLARLWQQIQALTLTLRL